MIKFLIIFALSILEMGCANHPAGNNYGMYSGLLNDAGRFFPSNGRRYTGAASTTFRTLDRQARRQAFEDKRRMRAEQREQKRAAYQAEIAARQEAERQRWAAMTPAQRQAAVEARNKRDEALLGIIMWGITNSGGGGGSTSGSDSWREMEGRIEHNKAMQQRVEESKIVGTGR